MSDWIEGTKPKIIKARYSAYLSWDLEELGIDWDNVKDYYIKYGTLYVEFKDGTTSWYDGDEGETDYKWARYENVLDEDWNKVEGLN